MAFWLAMQRLPKDKIEQKVRAPAEKLGITEYMERKPMGMSSVQR